VQYCMRDAERSTHLNFRLGGEGQFDYEGCGFEI